MSISLSFPAWYGIVCVVIGLAYAIFLYRNDKLLKELSRSWKILLSSFRFIIVTILALLLLEPLLESVTSKVEKPVIVLLQDNSESLLLSRDSAVIQSEFIEQLAALKTDLGEKYEIQSYTFGNEIRQGLKVDFTDKTTNISNVFDEVYTRYYNRNVGAIILATDGIYNSGTDPTYSAQKIKNTSIFTIALGDTNSRKDIIITEIAYNRLAYLGNIFPIEIAIAGKQCEGAKTSVDIIHDGKTISSQIISIDKNEYFTIVPFQIEANKSGLQKYSVVVSSIEGELTVENNSKEIYIEVLNSKQKVLLLAGAANPDIYALKVAVEKNKNYEVDVQLLSEFKEEVNDYSLVIAHQIPFKSTSLPEVLNFSSSRIPIFYVLGSQTNFNKFNSLNAGLNLLAPKGVSEAQALLNTSFSLFTLDDDFKRDLEKYPPIAVPFANDYLVNNSAEIMCYQKIGRSQTNFPLLLFNKSQQNKCGIFLGEGLWRWRMADYRENNSHERFDNFFAKIVTYLASKEDKSFFRIYTSSEFREDEDIIFNAELYNESYELINNVEVQLSVFNEVGEEFNFSFTPVMNSYRLNCKRLPEGEYSYVASANRSGEVFEQKGMFSIAELKVEMINATANHSLLFNIADRSGGSLFYPNQLDSLKSTILSKKEIVDVSYFEKNLTDLVNWRWICFLLIFFLGIEWFLRKYHGAY
ncbi:MAG: VWA domain-containing protein [Crocinitomicaceae bacterium]|jgi:hypothetical protein|nr:VWA domain-containing protein [Crocinitomicaceae bacterium]MBT6514439.1 VWA domain-containing protein [Crocinitomicaceae bacterium]